MNRRKKHRSNLPMRIGMLVISISVLILTALCVILVKRLDLLEKRMDNLVAQEAVAEVQQKMLWEEFLKEQTTSSVSEAGVQEETSGLPEVRLELESQTESEAGTETKAETETDSRKKVYLTFDDGPSKNTNSILDILKQYDIKATFFVTGKTDEESQEAYRRIVKEGHTLGMHSYSHAYSEVYASKEAFEADLLKLQDYLYEVTGVQSRYYRFPGGSSNTISSVDMQEFISCLYEHDIEYFDWNVSSGDGGGAITEASQMIENVMRDVSKYNHSVVLMHDDSNKDHTVEFLPALLDTLKEQDYALLPIDDALEPVQHLRPEDRKVEDR